MVNRDHGEREYGKSMTYMLLLMLVILMVGLASFLVTLPAVLFQPSDVTLTSDTSS